MSSAHPKKALPVYEFYFHCEQDFRAMRPVDKEGRVRRCDECDKNVYQVRDAAELERRTAARECVSLQASVAAELLAQLPDCYLPDASDMLSGIPLPLEPGSKWEPTSDDE